MRSDVPLSLLFVQRLFSSCEICLVLEQYSLHVHVSCTHHFLPPGQYECQLNSIAFIVSLHDMMAKHAYASQWSYSVPSLTSQYQNLNEYSSMNTRLVFVSVSLVYSWEVLIWVYHSLVDCPPGMEYQMCGLSIHCSDLRVVRDCRNSTCESGCFCNNGTVLEDGVCVHPDTCPSKTIWNCLLNDKDYNYIDDLLLK